MGAGLDETRSTRCHRGTSSCFLAAPLEARRTARVRHRFRLRVVLVCGCPPKTSPPTSHCWRRRGNRG